MADVATPSAAAITTSDPTSRGNTPAQKGTKAPPPVRPDRPDEEIYKKELEKLEADWEKAKKRFDAAKAKTDIAFGNKNSEVDQQRQALRKELGEIRAQQGKSKEARSGVQKRIEELDTKLKAKIDQQKEARKKVEFRSVEDIEKRIAQLQKDVDSSTMKLVDEKKALQEISNLNRVKKNFGSFEEADKVIADLKKQIQDLKKSREDPEQKALSDRYAAIAKQLDDIKANQDAAYQNRNSLKEEQNNAFNDKQAKHAAVKAHKDKFFEGKRAAREYEREAAKQRAVKRQQERDQWEAGKRKQLAEERLEEASAPAYQSDINTAEGILRYFDPTSVPAKEAAPTSKFAAAPARNVGDGDFKGMKLASKKGDDFEDYFVGGAGKKKKGASKSKKEDDKLQITPQLIHDLGAMGLDTPMSTADVPAVVEKVKAKLAFWKENQAQKTKENIAAAKKEIERLEREGEASNGTTDHAKKVASQNAGVNGPVSAEQELAQEEDGETDAKKDLADAKAEDAAN